MKLGDLIETLEVLQERSNRGPDTPVCVSGYEDLFDIVSASLEQPPIPRNDFVILTGDA